MRPGEVGNASVATRQVRQNLPARRIGQRGKSPVQRSRRIFNHLVNYLAESLRRANIFLEISRSFGAACVSPELPVLNRLANCESIGFASTNTKCPSHFDVEAFVSNACYPGARRGERRYNNVYEPDCVNVSLFTTYGIFVGSPP